MPRHKVAEIFWRLFQSPVGRGQGVWRFEAETLLGKVRQSQQDRYRILPPKVLQDGRIAYACLVCDGVGGAALGAEMAELACSTIAGYWEDVEPANLDSDWPRSWGIAPLTAANDAILELKIRGVGDQGSGSTATLAVFVGDTVTTFHVGDSPAIIKEGRTIRQFTIDHDERTLFGTVRRNVLYYSLGNMTSFNSRYDRNEEHVVFGQTVLICTDGLIKEIAIELLTDILARRGWVRQSRDFFDALLSLLPFSRLRARLGYLGMLEKIRAELLGALAISKQRDNTTFILARYEKHTAHRS